MCEAASYMMLTETMRIIVVTAVLTGCLTWIASIINNAVPLPYMDEVFHIKQARQYCAHNFSHWDPMITTLPGLYGRQLHNTRYLYSVLVLTPLASLTGSDLLSVCSVNGLRAVNITFIIGCFLILHNLSSQKKHSLSLLYSLTLTSFPVLFFFSFLYYTDPGSTFFVLLGYWFTHRNQHMLSAMALSVAILFRQTNVVWVVFVTGITALEIVEPHINHSMTKREKGWLSWLLCVLNATFYQLPALVLALWPYLLVVVGFMVFVFTNGSIVVGDKTHHQASIHLPQLYYYCSVTCVFAVGPLLLSHTRLVIASLHSMLLTGRGMLAFCLVCVTGLAASHYLTYEHPYLLADNRHYPFYLWKNLFRYHYAVKYLLVPLHSTCMIIMGRLLAQEQSNLWILLYLVSCSTALIPQALLEFRYYIIAYLLFRLHSPAPSLLGAMAELATYTVINIITIYLFLYRPFLWPDSDELQRFMW